MARHVSPQSGPCFSSHKEGGQQRRFCLEAFLRFPLDLNMCCHVASVCVWDASG